jgi:hypothetical protein
VLAGTQVRAQVFAQSNLTVDLYVPSGKANALNCSEILAIPPGTKMTFKHAASISCINVTANVPRIVAVPSKTARDHPLLEMIAKKSQSDHGPATRLRKA